MRAKFFLVLAAVLALTALSLGVIKVSRNVGSIDFVNDSYEKIVIMEIDGTRESVYDEIDADGGVSVLPRWFQFSNCIDEDLEARLEDGTVLGARPGPFCSDDPAWVITQQDVERARTAGE